jgi:hypothetical protein
MIQTPSFEAEVDLYSNKVWFVLRRAEWKTDSDYLICGQIMKNLEAKYKGRPLTDETVAAIEGSFRSILQIEIQAETLVKICNLWTWRNK